MTDGMPRTVVELTAAILTRERGLQRACLPVRGRVRLRDALRPQCRASSRGPQPRSVMDGAWLEAAR